MQFSMDVLSLSLSAQVSYAGEVVHEGVKERVGLSLNVSHPKFSLTLADITLKSTITPRSDLTSIRQDQKESNDSTGLDFEVVEVPPNDGDSSDSPPNDDDLDFEVAEVKEPLSNGRSFLVDEPNDSSLDFGVMDKVEPGSPYKCVHCGALFNVRNPLFAHCTRPLCPTCSTKAYECEWGDVA